MVNGKKSTTATRTTATSSTKPKRKLPPLAPLPKSGLKKKSSKKTTVSVPPPVELSEEEAKKYVEQAKTKKAVGYGSFAHVYKVQYKGQTCALKLGTTEEDEFGDTGQDMLQHEIERLIAAQGVKHCIRTIAYYKWKSKSDHIPPIVLLQWAPKDLCENASDFSPKQLLKIWHQIFVALQELHKKQVHFDVKPENIVLDQQNHAFLADFGLAESNYSSRKCKGHEASGSPGFEAPEVRKGVKRALGYQCHKVDIWSAGVSVLQGMRYADSSFSRKHSKALNLLEDGKDVNLEKHFLVKAPAVRRFIEKTMHPKARMRCTARQGAEMIEDLIKRGVSWV
eukprot:gene1303-279_t